MPAPRPRHDCATPAPVTCDPTDIPLLGWVGGGGQCSDARSPRRPSPCFVPAFIIYTYRGKRQRTRTGRGPHGKMHRNGRGPDAGRTRAWPFLPTGFFRKDSLLTTFLQIPKQTSSKPSGNPQLDNPRDVFLEPQTTRTDRPTGDSSTTAALRKHLVLGLCVASTSFRRRTPPRPRCVLHSGCRIDSHQIMRLPCSFPKRL
eukprot:gene18131-biopygen21920